MKKTISQVVSERILILDGAMGTMIQQYNLKEEDFRGERFAHIPGQLKGNNDLLCLTRPDVIQDIHRKYLEAGADIIETNTFSSTTVSMADYHVEEYVREMNLAAVKLARDLADEYTAKNPDKPRFVAGSVGPTNKTCSMSPDVNNPAYRALSYDACCFHCLFGCKNSSFGIQGIKDCFDQNGVYATFKHCFHLTIIEKRQ